MSKKSSFGDILANIRARTVEWFSRGNDRLVQHLIESGVADNALKAGAQLPDFMLPSADGRMVNSSDLLGKGPLVLSFYRGVWCPYCSAELNALADTAPRLRALDAQVIAITPEAGGQALKTKRERNFAFEILCDIDNGVAMEFGLVFRLPKENQEFMLKVDRDLPKIYGNDSWFLPIPATYVVRPDGVIHHAYVNPDFRERLDPDVLLNIVAETPR
jgi:peroxiredoxin